MAARRPTAGILFVAAVGSFTLKQLWGFVNYSRTTVQAPAVQLRASSYEQDYPDLARIEGLIQDSCVVKEGDAEMNCLRMYDKLTKFHEKASKECNLDNLKCIVLDVLDRLCSGIESGDGTILLNRVSNAVTLLHSKFANWDKAFSHYDTDKSGDLDRDQYMAMMKTLKVGLSEEEAAICFFAADANGDGKISPEEFSNFMTAAVFAEEIEADPVPKKMKTTEDFLSWATKDRDLSWGSNLAKLYR